MSGTLKGRLWMDLGNREEAGGIKYSDETIKAGMGVRIL